MSKIRWGLMVGLYEMVDMKRTPLFSFYPPGFSPYKHYPMVLGNEYMKSGDYDYLKSGAKISSLVTSIGDKNTVTLKIQGEETRKSLDIIMEYVRNKTRFPAITVTVYRKFDISSDLSIQEKLDEISHHTIEVVWLEQALPEYRYAITETKADASRNSTSRTYFYITFTGKKTTYRLKTDDEDLNDD